MRIVTLRARVPGATQIRLHTRLTLLVGASEADRDLVRSTFSALTAPGVPGLEALVDINGVTVPLDPAFPATYGLEGATSAVLDVPGGPAATSDVGSGFSNSSRIATLGAEERAVQHELALVKRALSEERGSVASGSPASHGGSIGSPTPGRDRPTSEEVRDLVERLRPLVVGQRSGDAAQLADRLDELGGRQVGGRDRGRALAQLMTECDAAVNSAEQALDRVVSDESASVPTVVEIARLRDEMLEIAAHDNISRRQRRRLAELRSTEQTMLAELGHSSYAALVASGSTDPEPGSAERQGQTTARLDLLAELREFWRQRQDQLAADVQEEERLLTEAARLLGDERPAARLRSPRLAAARLRAVSPREPAPDSMAQRVAARLADALELDPRQELDPPQILELAESWLEDGGAASEFPPAGPVSNVPPRVHTADVGSRQRIQELQDLEAELTHRLRAISERLGSLERASEGPLSGAATGLAGVDQRVGVPPGSFDPGSWSLAEEIELRRSQWNVSGLPILVMEPTTGGSVLDHIDPLSVVALGATTQIVWITDRPEVAAAVAEVGDLAAIIRV